MPSHHKYAHTEKEAQTQTHMPFILAYCVPVGCWHSTLGFLSLSVPVSVFLAFSHHWPRVYQWLRCQHSLVLYASQFCVVLLWLCALQSSYVQGRIVIACVWDCLTGTLILPSGINRDEDGCRVKMHSAHDFNTKTLRSNRTLSSITTWLYGKTLCANKWNIKYQR